MRERYHDAMTIVGKFGTPDLFITFTSNPNWTEKKNTYIYIYIMKMIIP